jgi:hypothetical protein
MVLDLCGLKEVLKNWIFHLYNVDVKKKLSIVFQSLQKFPNNKIGEKKPLP